MYIPPLVDRKLGLEENQLLIENKMVLGGASGSWNSTYVNRVGDKLPDIYRRRYVVEEKTGRKSIRPVGEVMENLPPGYSVRGMEILDMGCGKGRVAHDMAMYTGGRAYGINSDVSQLQNAMRFALDRNLWPDTLDFYHSSLNDKLPFENESLDFVYEIGAFTYMIDKLAVFKEIYRVLRPGGAFCYNDWTLQDGYDPNDPRQVDDLLKIKKLSGLIELHNPQELKAVAEQAGFEVIWNSHGGYNADQTTGLLSNMQGSFWVADFVMDNLIKYKILPRHLIKAWQHVRPSEGKVLKKSMEEKWLDVGHIFLIRKPYK